MKKVFVSLVIAVITFASCNQTGRIVTDTPIKTNILGIELCKKMSSDEVADSLMKNTDRFFLSMPQKNGNAEVYRSMPMGMNFTYGGMSWSYIDVAVTSEKEVHTIYLVGSYESVENAKQQYNSAVELFTQKYGKGNSEIENNTFWTDNVNSVGLIYEASSAIDGSDRSFCYLYYTNRLLNDKAEAENQLDI